jgi:nondiscriminating aspartyl-tRNA synthetase
LDLSPARARQHHVGDPPRRRRADLEAALRAHNIDPVAFESHLRMFELGMPPHSGLAIGLERLTAQVMGLPNVREAVLYPRDRDRLTP